MSKNVNNWHWEERDRARKYLHRVLLSSTDDVKTVKIESVEGDAAVMQRKGRVMALFDVAVSVTASYQNQNYKVTFDLCSETCGDDIQVSLSPKPEDSAKVAIETHVKGIARMFSKDIIEGIWAFVNVENKSLFHASAVSEEPKVRVLDKSVDKIPVTSPSSSPCHRKAFTCTLPLSAPSLRNMLASDDLVLQWTAGRCRKDGNETILYDGLIHYCGIEVDGPRIRMKWRLKDWADYARLEVDTSKGSESSTDAKVSISDCVGADIENMEGFFDQYYWKPMLRLAGIF